MTQVACMGEIHCVTLPDIGEGVVEGEVIEWLKKEGDTVQQDEPVVVVMTDKATVELPAPCPGVIAKHYHEPGEIAIKDKPLYDIETAEPAKNPRPEEKAKPKAAKAPPLSQPKRPEPIQRSGDKVLATPAVRRLAKDLAVNINEIKGTGNDGRVTTEDIRNHIGSTSPKKKKRAGKRAAPEIVASTSIWNLEGDTRTPLIGFRNYIAEKMVESKYIVPHFAYFDKLDATRLIQMRDRIKGEAESHGVKLSFMPFFIRALSIGIWQFPQFNSSVDLEDNSQVIHQRQNIGLAMKTSEGVIVPVLKDVQDMSFHEVIQSYDKLRKKALADALEASDMKESTITISNFGTEGGLFATPIINYPEVCIVGLARIMEEPVVKGGEVVVRNMLNVSWCCDHRVIDGDAAAQFSNFFIKLLENPSRLL